MAIKVIPEDPKMRELIEEVMLKVREQKYTPEQLCEVRRVIDAQHFYWWCMDMKREEWAGSDLFTEDFSYYCFGPQKVTAKEQAERSKHVNANMATTHMGHQPLVWLMDENNARAIFMYEDHNMYKDDGTLVRGWAIYIDDFVRGEDDKWRMKTLRLNYLKMDGRYRM